MASFAYRSQLLLYDNDDGTQSLRHQKLKIVAGTTEPIIPITPLMAAREVSTLYQYEGTNQNLRHLNCAVDGQSVKAVIPYGSSDVPTLKACVREILDSPGVIAGLYVGESENHDDTANYNL